MHQTSYILLIVDDSPEDRELYRRYLQHDSEYSYIIWEASLGQQSLDHLQQQQPDAILLDYQLPDLDGLEFLAQLQASPQTRDLPVIVITGQGNETIAVQAMKAGAQDYLVKDQVTPEGLKLAVNEAIAAVQRRSQLNQRINQQLRESEERFSQLADNINAVFWVKEMPEDRVSYVSPAYERLWGWKPEELYADQQVWVRHIHPEDQAAAEQAFQQKAATGQFDQEYRIVLADGSIRWVHDRCFPLRDQTGAIYRFVGIAEDVTDRKRPEQALREREERFRTMADNAPMMIWVTDATGYCIYLSKSWYDCTGQTEATGLGLGRFNAVHPDDYLASREAFLSANARREAFRLEYRLRYKDGIYRWAIDAANPWFGEMGEFKGYVGCVIDISEHKQVEEDLRQSEERYRTVFESMNDGFCVIEMLFDDQNQPIDYRFLEINPVFEQQTGLKQAKGKTVRQLLPQLEDHWFEIYGQVALTGESIRFEEGSDVMSRWFDVSAFRIEPPESRKVALLFKDISERKQVERERDRLFEQEQATRAEAERANRIKDEFLAVLSHELRSPLNPILGWTKLLQTRNFDQARTAEALAIIERNAKLQTQLIDDLLDIAKILRGKLSMDMAPVNLTGIIASAIDTVKAAALSKSILLYPDLPNIGWVSGDTKRLQQIVWNLLSNAIKFTPSGGRIELCLTQVGDEAEIIVRDTGKGIHPDFLPHIFESFQQEDLSITRKYGGLGLGLAIVHQLVADHGGSITAESPGEGLGATFTVRLPLLNATADIQRSEEPLPQPAPDLTGIRVLAVDDDPDARELVTVLLSQYGAEVLTVASAAEVLANLETFQPDLLVSDIGMPEVDGYSLIQQIRSRPAEKGGRIPAIALTAYAREIDQQRVIRSGYQRHVTKPLDPEQLAQTVVALVQRHRTTTRSKSQLAPEA